MNDQVMPPNSAGAGERGGARPEDLHAGAADAEAISPEMSPQPGSTPAPTMAAANPKLTPAQVAAAISAMPGGGTPPGVTVSPSSSPAVADDVDVIEPEWVEKAEEAVQKHQGDPYGEEEAVEELQEDYLAKRYGYKVTDPNQSRDSGPTGKPGGA